MLIKKIGGNNNSEEGDTEEVKNNSINDEDEFSPVSEDDIIAHEEKLIAKEKQKTPISNFIDSVLNKRKEEKVLIEHFEKPKPSVDETKKEKDQIEALVEMAMKDGVEKAVEVAKKSKSPYIIDAFHDRLIEEMRKNGKM
ncbi:hypothetical protein M0R01_04295 [bacterium]|nr:hypothetical protein [bacterium]